eukprot:TRINITY_DN5292_c0_g1_i2.p2 TRINITY_DN5292_c0_g1~~TRINITY_DN5292_c0_g1_i2.p2  ORF type:complete len:202 (+),score=19.61 TRINITY_DN5292_c0_g1_i2:176-781(+)
MGGKRSPIITHSRRKRPSKAPTLTMQSRLRLLAFFLVAAGPCVLIAFLEVNEFGQEDFLAFHPSPSELPAQQALRLKLKRQNTDGSCRDYGVVDDIYFPRFNGEHCGLTTWQSSNSHEEPGRFLANLEIATKTFGTEHDANEYYWRFWGRHMYQPIPYHLLMDMTLGSTEIGKTSTLASNLSISCPYDVIIPQTRHHPRSW